LYKVLLADDEGLDLAGLQCLIDWKQLQMEVVAAVNSGFVALEVLRKEHIDLLVTDIKMPIMSGLELAEKALEILPSLRVIFVSGYQDFNYARQAIQMNAHGYVLKPVDDNEMLLVLGKALEEIQKIRSRELIALTLENSIPYVKNEILSRLIESKGTEKVRAELMKRAGLDWYGKLFYVSVIETDDISWKLNHYDEAERADIIKRLNEYIMNWCDERGINFCKSESYRTVLFLSDDSSNSDLELLITEINENFPLSITIAIGPVIRVGAEDLHSSYDHAKKALKLKMFFGKSRMIHYADSKLPIEQSVKHMDEILNDLFVSMSVYDLVRTDDNLQELFQQARRLDSKISVYNFSLHVISKLENYLSIMNENLYSLLGLETENLDILYHFETLGDIQSWLRRRMFEISELLHLKKQKKNNKLVLEIITYIEGNLHNNITLRDVANYFSFSPNHMGHLFKEETGENFSDYVIQARLSRARQLLKDPKLKIYEVADRVGYKNLTYFSKQFRETFGMTPGDYRKQS